MCSLLLLSQGTPGTYLPSHAVYGPEGTKSTVGSISLGLPRQQDPNKPGMTTSCHLTKPYIEEAVQTMHHSKTNMT